MIPWIITRDVDRALNRQAAVALIGPRQVGETMLTLGIGRSRDALHLGLEDRDDRSRLAEPALNGVRQQDPDPSGRLTRGRRPRPL